MKRVVLVAVLVLLGGCSAIKLAYNNADTYLRWQAGRWFDLASDQREELDPRVTALLAWHRANALPKYARIADEAALRVERGLKREDLRWISDTMRAEARDSLLAAAREAAPSLDRLTAEQIAHLERRLARENAKFAEEQLQGTDSDRRERRLKRMVERVEEWMGRLDDAQMERLRRHNDSVPFTEVQRDAQRKRVQTEFVAIARAREARTKLADWAMRVFPENGRGMDPTYAGVLQATEERFFEALVDIARTASPAQRREALAKIRAYAHDFRILARGPETQASATR